MPLEGVSVSPGERPPSVSALPRLWLPRGRVAPPLHPLHPKAAHGAWKAQGGLQEHSNCFGGRSL